MIRFREHDGGWMNVVGLLISDDPVQLPSRPPGYNLLVSEYPS